MAQVEEENGLNLNSVTPRLSRGSQLSRRHREEKGDTDDNVPRIEQHVGDHTYIDIPGPLRNEDDR